MKKSKKLIIIFTILAVLGIGGTIAYLSSYDIALNEVVIAFHESGITEEFPKVTPTPIEENPQYKKTVAVKNNPTTVPVYVRARFEYSNEALGDAVVIEGLNTTDWVKSSDGYYYYKTAVAPGESTKALFTGFHIDSSKVRQGFVKDYLKTYGNFRVDVYEESIEAGLFSSYTDAWSRIDRKGA